jgi:hypothetical protein
MIANEVAVKSDDGALTAVEFTKRVDVSYKTEVWSTIEVMISRIVDVTLESVPTVGRVVGSAEFIVGNNGSDDDDGNWVKLESDIVGRDIPEDDCVMVEFMSRVEEARKDVPDVSVKDPPNSRVTGIFSCGGSSVEDSPDEELIGDDVVLLVTCCDRIDVADPKELDKWVEDASGDVMMAEFGIVEDAMMVAFPEESCAEELEMTTGEEGVPENFILVRDANVEKPRVEFCLSGMIDG